MMTSTKPGQLEGAEKALVPKAYMMLSNHL